MAQPACILSAEDCGVGLAWVDGRCVPLDVPDEGLDDGSDAWPAADAWLPPVDATPVADARRPPDAQPGQDPWAPMFTVLVVDRTPDQLLGESPSTPGCDLDGVRVMGPGLDAVSVKLLASLVFDPFDQSIGRDELASVGAPEQTGEVGTYVSLGGGGAYQLLLLEAQRPLARGDHLLVAEYAEPRDFGDVCGVWLCDTDFLDLSRCLWVGEGRGGDFELP